jgi:hypothetical protein
MFLWCGQYMPSEHKFFGAVKFEGPADKASQYTYTFKLSKYLGRAKLKVGCTVLAAPFESVFRNEGSCVILDLQTIKRFSHGNKLSFVVKIDSPAGKSKQHLSA